ncbi:hypothetical protein RchiOBHm_Chr4g0415741 [Rosa chinensis]|uniref:Uncharacterized protein n=1 Tax=Rosa chinensis TaxID=74649 RepID=A0A2P6QWQ1_ROSCH|nr:hypothetical protein RchiOBHm_Chr4g0415741 [Rosa chinensis]
MVGVGRCISDWVGSAVGGTPEVVLQQRCGCFVVVMAARWARPTGCSLLTLLVRRESGIRPGVPMVARCRHEGDRAARPRCTRVMAMVRVGSYISDWVGSAVGGTPKVVVQQWCGCFAVVMAARWARPTGCSLLTLLVRLWTWSQILGPN